MNSHISGNVQGNEQCRIDFGENEKMKRGKVHVHRGCGFVTSRI